MLFALIFPRAERASTSDISAERNVWLQSALRSFAIVCDYMETDLFAIVCDLRSAIRDRLRSFAIIWKPALKYYPRRHCAPSLIKSRFFPYTTNLPTVLTILHFEIPYMYTRGES